jgi:hypothetical protein
VIFFRKIDARSSRRSLCQASVRSAIWAKALFLAGLLVAGWIAVGQASGQDFQTNEQQKSVRGTVVNAVTHAPIARALVYSLDNRFAMLTDSEGRFEFSLPKEDSLEESGALAPGSYIASSFGPATSRLGLMARKPGFLDDRKESSEIEASPGNEITISLMPEALIKGRVTLSTNDPATGVSVQLFLKELHDGLPRWVPGPSARANSAGEFRFAELPAGSYKLLTHELMDNDPVGTVPGGQLYGFPPVYYPGAADFAAAAPIELLAGQTVEADLSLTRQPYYDVRIPVANGEVNGLSVQVYPQGHRAPGYSLGYNGAEHRVEGLLPNGNYVVEGEVIGTDSAAGTVNIKVAGGPVAGPTMTLIPNGSISLDVKEEFSDTKWNGSTSWSDGRHTFSSRGARAYLQVSAETADDSGQPRMGSLRPPTRPNDNALVLENLAPGRYWLRLSTSRGYVAAATMGTTDLLREPMVVAPGASTTVEIKMRDDGAELEGSLGYLSAEPSMTGGAVTTGLYLQKAWVYCVPLPDSAGQFQQLGVSADGTFTSPMMTPGDYRVLAFATQQPNLPYRDPEAMRAYESKGPVIHLAAGQKANVQLQVIANSE